MTREPRSIDLGGGSKNHLPRDSRFYCVRVRCTNCGHAGDCKIPKGLTVELYPCPHCHCSTLMPLLKQKKEE